MEKQTLSMQNSVFRHVKRPIIFHKANEASVGKAKKTWNKMCDIHGRFNNHVTDYRANSNGQGLNMLDIQSTWVNDQHKKECARTLQEAGISRDNDRFSTNETNTIREKLAKIVNLCELTISQPKTTVRQLSSLMGKLASTAVAVIPSPLYLRNLQRAIREALIIDQSYESQVYLNQEVIIEINWWKENIIKHNGSPISPVKPEMTITSDASMIEWGAHCQSVSTGGRWTQEELQEMPHINILECSAALKAIKIFHRINTSPDRHYVRPLIHCKKGGQKQSDHESISQGDLGISTGQEMPADSRIHSIEGECGLRQGKQEDRFNRMEIKVKHFQEHLQSDGSSNCGPVCLMGNKTVTQICDLKARPSSLGHRRLPTGLEKTPTSSLLSTIQIDK